MIKVKLNPLLRPDVYETVKRLIEEAPVMPPADWNAYERAKKELSKTCGWAAQDGKYDQRQYDLAMACYCKAMNL